MAVVVCSTCGAESAAGKRFCADCGAALGLACPSCGAEVAPAHRFCADCGTPLTAESTASRPESGHSAAPVEPATGAGSDNDQPVAERRMCSVLFVDLVGFTTASETRDPEEVRELLSGYFDLARSVASRYGGTIEKFIGDAVMAVWGTPVATELDAERAVRAAFDLVDGVGQLGAESGVPGLAARAGVLTGEVAVTIGATNQGMVAGDAVNTAARIQAAAEPGTVFVDAATRRLTGNTIAYTDKGHHLLKGKAEPEQLWRAAHVMTGTGGNQRVDGLEAPLVGRNAELRSIREMFLASAERRQPRLVLVTGPAGVGKSRLGWEFEKYVDGLADTVLWHRGRCLSYGQGMVYWALAEVVRQRFQIAEDDPPEVAAARFAAGLSRWLPEPAERDFIAPRLGRLIGVPTTGDSGAALNRDELFAGWRRFFERLAADAPVAILIEDLHNAASDLLDFLDHLIDWARDLPIFVLAFGRPELDDVRPGFGSGRNRATIALDPLDAVSMDAIADALVPGMPVEARHRIVDRAEGIPLYAVESIRALIDRGVIQGGADEGYRLVGGTRALSRFTVPESLRALLAARLDALDPTARRVVGDASVLGASFPAEAVVAVSGLAETEVAAVLADLLHREVFVISADPLSPQRGNYGFAQEMLRQVAYDTLSRRDRKARHLAVARHLRASFPGDGEEVIDAVARHYADALDAAPDDPDADELRGLLAATLIRAGERSTRTGAPARAAESLAAASDLLAASDPARAAQLLLDASHAIGLTGDTEAAVRMAEQGGALAASAGQERLAATAMVAKGQALRRQGRHTEARTVLTEALTVLRQQPAGDTLDAVEALASLEIFAGGFANARPLYTEVFDLANQLGSDDHTYSRLLSGQAIMYEVLGQRRLSQLYFRESIRLGEEAGATYDVALALLNLGNSLLTHDPRASLDASRRARALAVDLGGSYLGAYAVLNVALAQLMLDEWDAAEETLRDQMLLQSGESAGACVRAQLRAMRGDAEGARAELAGLDEAFVASEDPQDVSAQLTANALALAVEGDPEAALAKARECVGLIGTSLGFAGDDGRYIWPFAARLAHELGRFEVEAELLAEYEKQPLGAVAPLQVAEAELIRARLAAAKGDPEAGARFETAIAMMRQASPRYHLAWGLLDHAEHLLDGAADADVSGLVEESLQIATSLSCTPLAARAERVEARRASSGPGAATGGISPEDPARVPVAEESQVC